MTTRNYSAADLIGFLTEGEGSGDTTDPVILADIAHGAAAGLAMYARAIAVFDQAQRDYGRAVVEAASEAETMDRIEASSILTIEGSNVEIRKARLTLALADDARYQAHKQLHEAARERVRDAERRRDVAKEICRMQRAGLAALSDALDR